MKDMLKSVHMKNFRQHADVKLEFTEGLNVIVGPNYCGKTTVLLALRFAWFGAAAVPIKAGNLKRRGARGMSVEVCWVVNGAEYTVERKSNTATLWKNGEEVAKGNKPVAKEIQDMFGMDYKQFLEIRHAQQGHTAALLTLGADKLTRIVEEAAGSKMVTRVIAACSEREKLTKAQAEVLDDLPDLDALGAEIERLSSEQREEKRRLDQLQEQASIAQDYATRLNQWVNMLIAQRGEEAKIREAQAAVRSATEALQEVGISKEGAQAEESKAAAEVERLQGLNRHWERTYQWLQRCAEDLERAQAEKDKLRKRGEAAGERYNTAYRGLQMLKETTFDATLEEARQNRDGWRQILNDRNADVAHLQAKIDNGICQACNRPFDEADVTEADHRALEEAREAVQEAREGEQGWGAVLEEIQAHAGKAEAAERQVEALLRECDALVEDNEQATKAAEAAREKWVEAKIADDAAAEAMPADAELALANAKQRLEGAQQRLNVLQERERALATADRRLAELRAGYEQKVEDPGTTHEQLQEDVRAAGAAYEAKREPLAQTSARVHEIQRQIDRVNDQYQRGKADHERLAGLEGRAKVISELKRFISKRKDDYLDEIWSRILTYPSRLCSAVTGGRMTAILRDGNKFSYIEDGEEYEIVEASGAQRSMAAIGTHMALAQVVHTFPVVLLDEPTSDMRDETSAPVCSALASSGEQVIMISHKEFDAESADNTIDLGLYLQG